MRLPTILLLLGATAMAQPATKTTRVLETTDSPSRGLDKPRQKLLSTWSDYVRERMQYVDSRGDAFKKQRSAVTWTVHQLEPSPLKGVSVYLGLAIDRTGGEVDRPPTHFDQTAFLVGPDGASFLDFFKRASDDDGATWSDLPFCTQRYLVAIGRSVHMGSTAKERERGRKDVEAWAKTDCRSWLPELRAKLRFDAGVKENTAALEELAAFLTLLLVEHQAGGHSIMGLHTQVEWATGGHLPEPASWTFARGFDAGAMTGFAVRKWKDGFEAEAFALLDRSVLTRVRLAISPAEFSFRLEPRGAIPYGP